MEVLPVVVEPNPDKVVKLEFIGYVVCSIQLSDDFAM